MTRLPPVALAGAWNASPDARGRVPAPLVESGPFVVTGQAQVASSGQVVVALAGRVSDPGPLRRRLPELEPRAPAGLLAAAHGRLGPQAFDLLRGEWAAALWDAAQGSLTLACDPLGGRSLHFAASGAGVVFGEDVRDVLDLLPAMPAPDRRALCAWLAHAVTPEDATLYAGVERLVPGTALRLQLGRRERLSVWRPAYQPPFSGDEAELAARLRDGVDAAVARAAGDAQAPGVLLSGGLDSATVAAAMVAGSRPPAAYSATFPDHPEADESTPLDALAAHLGVPTVRAVVERGRPLVGGLRYLAAWRVPCASPNAFLWVPLLSVAAADGVDVVLDGEGGDELFGSRPFFLLADLAARGRLRAAWALTARYPGVRGRARRPRARVLAHFLGAALPPLWVDRRLRARRPPALLRADDAGAALATFDAGDWRRHGGPRWWAHRLDLLTRLRRLLDMPGTLRRIAALAPVAGRHPLMLDRDLVELALRLPPEASFDRRFNRPLARSSQAGRLPDAVRLRPTKSHLSGVLDAALRRGDGELLRSLLGGPEARVREYVDPDALRRLVDGLHGPPTDASLAGVGELWRLGAAECWLRQLEMPAFADELLARHGHEMIEQRVDRRPGRTPT